MPAVLCKVVGDEGTIPCVSGGQRLSSADGSASHVLMAHKSSLRHCKIFLIICDLHCSVEGRGTQWQQPRRS